MIQQMLAIWSLVPLPFQNLAWTFGSSQLTYYWSLAWRILSITLLALFFTALDFTSITIHIHNWALFSLWLHLSILSGVISPLFSSGILGTYWPGEFIFQCHIFFAFSYCSWGSQSKNTDVVCHSLLQWTTFCQNSPPWLLFWVGLHDKSHSFIELYKALTHVIF